MCSTRTTTTERTTLKGLRAGLGAKASQIIAEVSYEVSDPTINSQIVQLKAAGIDTLIEQSSAKAAAQSIRKVHELNWTPLHIIGGSTASVETVLKPAGLDASKGLGHDPIPQATRATPPGPMTRRSRPTRIFSRSMRPRPNPDDYSVLVAYMNVHAIALALKKCGDQLTRENLIHQATSLNGERLPMMLPGVSYQHHTGRLRSIQDVAYRDLRWEELELVRRSGVRQLGAVTPIKNCQGRSAMQDSRVDEAIVSHKTYGDLEQQHALFSMLRRDDPVHWTDTRRLPPFWTSLPAQGRHGDREAERQVHQCAPRPNCFRSSSNPR